MDNKETFRYATVMMVCAGMMMLGSLPAFYLAPAGGQWYYEEMMELDATPDGFFANILNDQVYSIFMIGYWAYIIGMVGLFAVFLILCNKQWGSSENFKKAIVARWKKE